MSCRAFVGNAQKNLDMMERCLDMPGVQGAGIVCFPECSLTGYTIAADAASLAHEVPGPLTARLVETCAARGIALAAGLVERGREGCFITQVAAGPDGLMGAYRKTHLSPGEMRVFTPGRDFPVFAWNGFSFGIGLCYDAHFPAVSYTHLTLPTNREV